MFDDVNFRHSLLAGSSWNMVLEVLVAVIDCLDSASLPGIPPGHGYWDWRGYGVAEDWVVDHSALEFSVGRHLAWLAGWAGLDCTGCTDCHHCWGSCGATDRTGNLPTVSQSHAERAWLLAGQTSPQVHQLNCFLSPSLWPCFVSSLYMLH